MSGAFVTTCEACHGTGEATHAAWSFNGYHEVPVRCRFCVGTGLVAAVYGEPGDQLGVTKSLLDENGLAPCPFCGQEPTLRVGDQQSVVWCYDCNLRMGGPVDSVADIWNRRIP